MMLLVDHSVDKEAVIFLELIITATAGELLFEV